MFLAQKDLPCDKANMSGLIKVIFLFAETLQHMHRLYAETGTACALM